jgi:hypothetical protein
MNLIRAAATIALAVTVCAAAYLAYQLAIVRPRFDSATASVEKCTSNRNAALANWTEITDKVELLNGEGKLEEAIKLLKEHSGERPFFIGECSQFVDLTPPRYAPSGAIAVVGLITTMVLFGVSQPKD